MQSKLSFALENYWIDVQYNSKQRPKPRSGHSVVVYKQKYLYVFGGLTEEKSLNDLWQYDIQKQIWIQIQVKSTLIPTPRASTAMVCFDEFKKIYMFGGTDSNIKNICVNDILVFNIDNSTWKIIKIESNKPCQRFGHTLIRRNYSFYLFGGTKVSLKKQQKTNQAKPTNQFLNDIWQFNILSKIWKKIQTKGKQPQPRYRHQCLMLNNDELCILGGTSQQFRYGNLHILNLQTNTWSQINVLTKNNIFRGRFGHFAFVVDNRIVVYGGNQSSKICSEAIMLEYGKTNSWNRRKIRGNYPQQRQFFSGVYTRGKVIIFGGRKKSLRVNDMSIWNFRLCNMDNTSYINLYDYLNENKYGNIQINKNWHSSYYLEQRIKISKIDNKTKQILIQYAYLNELKLINIDNNITRDLINELIGCQLLNILQQLIIILLQDCINEQNYDRKLSLLQSIKNNHIIIIQAIQFLNCRIKLLKQNKKQNKILYQNKINVYSQKYKDIIVNKNKKYVENMTNIYNNNNQSDVKIICNNIIYNCHKYILCSNSHYFDGCVQPQTTQIILDIPNNKAVQWILKYIYTGKMQQILSQSQQQSIQIIKQILFLCGYLVLKDQSIRTNLQLQLSKKITKQNCLQIINMACKINAPILQYKSILYSIYHKIFNMQNIDNFDKHILSKIIFIQQNYIDQQDIIM